MSSLPEYVDCKLDRFCSLCARGIALIKPNRRYNNNSSSNSSNNTSNGIFLLGRLPLTLPLL